MKEKFLTANEVVNILGISINTLNNWYKFKRDEPDHHLAKLLPDYEIAENEIGRPRKWKQSDITKFFEFKANITVGRNGEMGNITQKYQNKGGK